jgi:hypothetical protein
MLDSSRFNFSIYELAMIFFFVIFVINCWGGKTKNDKYAQIWYSANKIFFEENYAHVGTSADYSVNSGVPLL